MNLINKPAATRPDISDKFMTEATSMATTTYWPLFAETFELFVGMIVNWPLLAETFELFVGMIVNSMWISGESCWENSDT